MPSSWRTCNWPDATARLYDQLGNRYHLLETDATGTGVKHCVARADDNELQLLLRLRYRVRVDPGLDEDDYDRMLDATHRQG